MQHQCSTRFAVTLQDRLNNFCRPYFRANALLLKLKSTLFFFTYRELEAKATTAATPKPSDTEKRLEVCKTFQNTSYSVGIIVRKGILVYVAASCVLNTI